MAIVTSWSIQSPNLNHWQATIAPTGVVTWATIGGQLTATPPVIPERDNPGVVYVPSISNTGVVTWTTAVDSGQNRAALVDSNGVQYVGVIINNAEQWIPPAVQIGDLVAVGLFEDETVPMIIKAIEPGPDLTATLTLVDAAPGVHEAATGLIPPFLSHITVPASGGNQLVDKPLLDHLASDETVMLRSSDGTFVPRIVLDLRFPSSTRPPAAYVELQHRIANSPGPWTREVFPATAVMQLSIWDVEEGQNYDIRVRAIGTIGQTSEWVTVEEYGVLGKLSRPPAATGLALNGSRLVWTYPNPPFDFAGFKVRMQVGTRASWGDAIPLHDGLLTTTSQELFDDTGRRTYLVKAFDKSQNEQEEPTTLFVDWGLIATRNIVELVDLKALGFPGTLTGGSRLGGDLVANSDTLFWKNDAQLVWGADTDLFWGGTYTTMVYETTLIPPMDWLGATLLLDLEVSGNGYQIEYAIDGPALYWGADAELFWKGDSDLWWSTAGEAWAPWPGRITVEKRQAIKLRLTLFGGTVQAAVERFQAIFDVPDLEEVLTNVPLVADGTRLPLTKRFRTVRIVVPVVRQDGGGAVRMAVVDYEADGPLVQPFDGTGIAVDGHGDFIVRGA